MRNVSSNIMSTSILTLAVVLFSMLTAPAFAKDKPKAAIGMTAKKKDGEAKKVKEIKTVDVSLAGGKLVLPAAASWKKVKPRFPGMIEAEFSITAAKGKKKPARMTMMQSGGGISANVKRWIGQFKNVEKNADGKMPGAKKETYGGLTVHMVDLKGSYMDKPFPRAPRAVEMKDYRMLAAIIETKGAGNYFVKFYGDSDTLKENEEAFSNMVKNLKWKKK